MFQLMRDSSAPIVFADDSGYTRDLTTQNALKYDSSGALVGDASRGNALSYDESGRLVAVTRMTPEGLAKTRYVYGADGTRLAKLTAAPSFPAVYTVGIHSTDNDFATMDDACAALQSVEDSLPTEEIVLLHIGESGSSVVHPAGSCLASRSATEKKIATAELPQDADYRARNFEIASTTHYHPEVEIRETTEETTVILEHPEGLGRTVTKQGDEQRPQSREIYIRDHLGNVRMTITDSLGNLSLVESVDYTPFGRRIDVYSKGVETTPQFTGKERDAETGLYHFGARQYDPELGMWASTDSIRFFHSPYVYMGNDFNPVKDTDPDGKCPNCLGALVGAGISAYDASQAYGRATGDWGLKNSLVTMGAFVSGATIGFIGGAASARIAGQGLAHVVADFGIVTLEGAVSGTATGALRIVADDQSVNLLGEMANGAIASLGTKAYGITTNKVAKATIGQIIMPGERVADALDQTVVQFIGNNMAQKAMEQEQ